MSSTTLTSEQLPLQRSPLRVSQPDDPLEQEAEAVADRVMRMPSPQVGLIQRCPGGCPDEEIVHRQPADEEDEENEEELIQRCPGGCPDDEMLRRQVEEEEKEVLAQGSPKRREDTATPPAVATAIQAQRGAGNPLPWSTRRFFEPRFAADFSMVRVHHNPESAQLAASVNARAFTVGYDLFFGSTQWAPDTAAGKRLIAHELTHIRQQQNTGAGLNDCSGTKAIGVRPSSRRVSPAIRPVSGVAVHRTLRFNVDDDLRIADRFTSLVNTLLPRGWEFSLRVRPLSLRSWEGQLRLRDQFRTLEQASPAWRTRFRGLLTRLISSGLSEFRLVSHARQVFVGSWGRGELDVGDLERMPPRAAASALIHELEEVQGAMAAPRGGQTLAEFNARHRAAHVGEAIVFGGLRAEQHRCTRPPNINLDNMPPDGVRWQRWEPYVREDGSIVALILYMSGHTVLRGRLAGFYSIADFHYQCHRP